MGKTTRSVRYDLNQILYDYTVDVTNRFKGSGIVNRVPKELWTEVHNIIWNAANKTIPKWGKMKVDKGVVWESFTSNWGKKRSDKQGRKGKVYSTEYRVPKNSKERLEGLLQWTMQRNRRKHQKGKD